MEVGLRTEPLLRMSCQHYNQHITESPSAYRTGADPLQETVYLQAHA